MRMTLFGPDVAVDGGSKLSYLGRRAARHRGLIVEAMLLMWAAPMALGVGAVFNQQYNIIPEVANNVVVEVMTGLVLSPFYGLTLISMSIMYKAFRREWPAMDAREAAHAAGEVVLKEAKPFNPLSGRVAMPQPHDEKHSA